MQANAKAAILSILQDGVRIYNESMTEVMLSTLQKLLLNFRTCSNGFKTKLKTKHSSSKLCLRRFRLQILCCSIFCMPFCKSLNQLFHHQVTGRGYLESKELINKHEHAKAKQLKWFDVQPKLGDADFIARYRNNLKELIDQQLAVHEQANAVAKVS